MRHAIADSDDEGDDEVYVSASTSNHNQQSASNPGTKDTSGEGANDADVVKNTNSTEVLRRQMLSAGRHLVSNSAPMAASAAMQSSPSMRVQKRRHSTVFGSGAATSPEKGVKRTKTITTYGAKANARVADQSAFDNLRDDARSAGPKTSQSARFSEHSGYHSSADLPTGSFGLEFANHEPAVMFQDSGSTVVDGSSAQQRMLEQALSSKKGTSTSAVQQVIDDEGKSSSFPWSPSEQTRSVRSTGKVKVGVDGPDGNGGGDEDAPRAADGDDISGKPVQSAADGAPEAPEATVSKKDVEDVDAAQANVEPPANDAEDSIAVRSASKPHASPVVEIHQPTTRITSTSRRDSNGSLKSARTRKRKSEEPPDSEPLNSDDKAIGLPKERYQPRPSRRQATQIVEEPIDYSIVPEKAAKAKRRKTAVAPTDSDSQISKEHLASLKADVEKVKTPSKTSEALSGVDETSNATNEDHAPPSADEGAANHTNQTARETPYQQSQPAEETSSSSKKNKDDHVFAKPALPTPKPKPASQSRRSRTTIFEDHVEFTGSQKSPSLSQQQATRKLAQEDVTTAVTKPSQRKRKIIVDVDEDDEDELVKDPSGDAEPENDEPAPTKRGRGRPAKAKPPAKSAKKVLEDSEDEEDDEKDEDEAEGEPPKRKGRGRPPKATNASKPATAETDKGSNAIEEPDATATTAPIEKAAAKTAATDLPQQSLSPNPSGRMVGKENITPSPSPEKPPEKPASTPSKDAKQSPTLHSPIKNTLGVPLRVGLSNRRRIPSLLKTIKPPKPKAQDMPKT